MTLFWLKLSNPQSTVAPRPNDPAAEPEYDEDGRRYVFRYTPVPIQSYSIDRDRLFHYVRTHELPGARARAIRRDQRNAASFYEDVREIQTHPDVVPAYDASVPSESVTRLRLRSAS